MCRSLLLLLLCSCVPALLAAQPDRWTIRPDGLPGVRWNVADDARLPHADNIEMSGRGVSLILHFAVDSARRVSVRRELIYPQFRPFIRNSDPDWHATYRNYLRADYSDAEVLPRLYLGDRELDPGPLRRVEHYGMTTLLHDTLRKEGLLIERTFFPAARAHRAREMWRITNVGDSIRTLRLGERRGTQEHRGAAGAFRTGFGAELLGEATVEPGKDKLLFVSFFAGAGAVSAEGAPTATDGAMDYADRLVQLDALRNNLRLETPEPIYNTLFALSKVRGAESIFDSRLGLVHSPGGGRYYTGFWANDQAEYINPFFPYLGYPLADSAALNMWRVYQRAIPPGGGNIRYSFEMAGQAPANPLDRGDAAMIAYGLSHYLLALGEPAVAGELWPLLEWCLEYNHRMRTPAGVVASQSDEMEGRIETGDANLSTSALYYGALGTSNDLARALGREDYAQLLHDRRRALDTAIERHFGRTVEGLDTYRYYAGHERLRHWIALPLVVGLHNRRAGTLEALFGRLWTDQGVHVERNHPDPAVSEIFWDRGTLYALRGAFAAGGTARAHERLLQFSRRRLLGERVPYVVEAFPEGDMAHLSAESGLYCRIFTEGLFGIRPTGFRSFALTPRLPEGWDRMALRDIRAFGQSAGFGVLVERPEAGQLIVTITESGLGRRSEYRIREGESLEHKLLSD